MTKYMISNKLWWWVVSFHGTSPASIVPTWVRWINDHNILLSRTSDDAVTLRHIKRKLEEFMQKFNQKRIDDHMIIS